ncbi:peptidase, M13 (neprilysin) family [Cystobacter fuscus DSM 2262]|uniref:Peptidase, M13 (Neprilysin) family n=1 Tax=Cystobacter fuscus (strain ATCC 25194 / DSM 2262 / NBRC 100088 / M29) TaxID=1242864 RepID=S9PBI3_CYSF2|nr:M13 family metallopeptidase [Cystobacter fuscus]EPX61780.1 peptidase, M13 (neprilysin) family [Cystobacter fuscus DSM 2262]
MNRMKFLRHAWAPGTLGACLLLGCAASTRSTALAESSSAAQAEAKSPALSLGVETKHFDTSVRPQDDFFRYVNGTWLKTAKIPADKGRYGSFIELRDKSEEALRTLIEESSAVQSPASGSDTQKVADFYKSFMDTERIQSLGIEPLRADLQRIAALKDKKELPELFAVLGRMGVQTPFGGFVGQDAKNAERYILYVNQSGLGLPDRDYYSKPEPRFVETRAAYLTYIETMMRLAGEKDPAGAAKTILALETALAEKHWDRVRNRDREATYNLKSVAELDALTPGFAWTSYLKAAGTEKSPAVIVRQPDYFQALAKMIQGTPLPTLKQYLTFKLVSGYAPLLSTPFEQAHFAFYGKTLQGLEEDRPRWKRGVESVDRALGEVLGRIYVERYFTPESKARMQKLVDNLRVSFKQGIDQLDWMSPETKAQAQQKLAKFNVKIGYPEKWRDYSALTVRADDLVGNVKRSSEVEYNRNVEKLGKPIDRLEWGMTPQTVNAYYNSSMNEIVFPAAILQPPFFDPQADDATNYGAIGGVIGHEISHGFDDQGSRSDGDGNLRDWWTAEDKAAFQQRTGQLSDQYSSFSPLQGMNVNGKLTLGENIGDLSGLTVAYKAYKLSLGGKEAPVIEGFTGDQRFFLGWAQVWRTANREDALRQQLLTDPHSPGEYRVNGVVRNMPEFYSAFGVKEGDGAFLPADKRVKIW